MTIPIDVHVEYQDHPVDVRCPNPRCNRLLHRIVGSDGHTIISDKCKCGTLVEVHVTHAGQNRAEARQFKEHS